MNTAPKHIVPLKDRLSLSPEEASALTGIGLTSIKTATYSGSLVARKHGRNTVIMPSDLKAWLEALPRMAPSRKVTLVRAYETPLPPSVSAQDVAAAKIRRLREAAQLSARASKRGAKK